MVKVRGPADEGSSASVGIASRVVGRAVWTRLKDESDHLDGGSYVRQATGPVVLRTREKKRKSDLNRETRVFRVYTLWPASSLGESVPLLRLESEDLTERRINGMELFPPASARDPGYNERRAIIISHLLVHRNTKPRRREFTRASPISARADA